MERHPQGEEIGADAPGAEAPLRRQEGRRAPKDAARRHSRSGQAQVHQARPPLVVDEHVGWLHVAVDQPLGVEGGQREGHPVGRPERGHDPGSAAQPEQGSVAGRARGALLH